MKRVAINISYDDKSYTSDYRDITDEELSKLSSLCEKIAGGLGNFLKIPIANQEHYFPKQILEKSIIALIIFDNSNVK